MRFGVALAIAFGLLFGVGTRAPLQSSAKLADTVTVGASEALDLSAPAPAFECHETRAESFYQEAIRLAGDTDPRQFFDALSRALETGACSTRTLTESAFQPFRSSPRFRNLMARHARQSSTAITGIEEPGQILVITGQIRSRDGRPVAGALVYAYQTDAAGYFNRRADADENPRLYGFARTDEHGRFEFRTIRPGAYFRQPDTEQCVRFEVGAPGHKSTFARLGFRDDPVWIGCRSAPSWVRPVDRDADGVERCVFCILLDPARRS